MTYIVPQFRYGALIYNNINEDECINKENRKY